MKLLTECNISIRKLPTVITTVLAKLTWKVPTNVPWKSVLGRLYLEAKIIASKQVADAMLSGFDATDHLGNVLHQDATSKYHKHFEGMQVTLKDGSNLSMGLKRVPGGSGDECVSAFEEIISDLAEACTQDGDIEGRRAKLICSIKAMMSDQCATNNVFNSSIEKMRSELLPTVVDNFEHMDVKEREDIMEKFTHACRLHLLANFAPAGEKGLAAYESAVCSGQNPHSFGEDGSGTFCLVRTAAKAFTKRGCDKAGIHSYFECFLQGRGKHNQFVTFSGHRFNIAFHDAAAVYYHREDIKDMLQSWPNPNLLLKSVLFDISEKVFIAGVRAAGIIQKLATGPFQTLLSKGFSILEINQDLHQMQIGFQNWTKDGSTALQGEPMFSVDRVSLKKDNLHEKLFAVTDDAELDSLTQMAVELMSAEMLILLKGQAESQLPGGKYWSPDDKTKKSSANVPAHNIMAERDMAILDNLLRQKPAASVNTLETSIM